MMNTGRLEEREAQSTYIAGSIFAGPEVLPSAVFDIIILPLEYDAG